MSRSTYLRWRRGAEIVAAGTLLVALSPVVLAVALGTLTTMGPPIFFRQERVGHRGVFEIIKFRTMVKDAEKLGGGYMDPKLNLIPRWGRFLRTTSLDELPQLFNILRGDMAFIGPRPALPNQVKRYTSEQMRRLDIPQGLTGLAQVMYRNEAPWSKRIVADLKYVDTAGPRQDLMILFRTVGVVLSRKGLKTDQASPDLIDDLEKTDESKQH